MNSKKAFSLIELSIVILIIGILIAGVTQSSRLIKQFRLSSGRAITQSAAVSSIRDLAVWYETTSEKSLSDSSTNYDLSDGDSVATWWDRNPQSTIKNNATSGTAPRFTENAINGLPTLRFDGSSTYMGWDGTILVNTNYTIFVVKQRTGLGPQYDQIIGGGTSAVNSNFQFGYYNSGGTNNFMVAHWGVSTSYTEVDYAIGTYSSTVPRIHTARLESGVKSEYWLNGGTSADATGTVFTQLSANTGSSIGRNAALGNNYLGELAEIIIFTRALKTEERQSIENYLSKKYNIKIS